MQFRISGLRAWVLAASASQLIIGLPVVTRAQDQASPPSSTAPDNSSRNKHQDKTADNQKESASDREITQKIRKSIVADKSLSTYAHNVKIITQGGQVTLKGPVRNQSEKESVASKASDVAGTGNVKNELTLKQ